MTTRALRLISAHRDPRYSLSVTGPRDGACETTLCDRAPVQLYLRAIADALHSHRRHGARLTVQLHGVAVWRVEYVATVVESHETGEALAGAWRWRAVVAGEV